MTKSGVFRALIGLMILLLAAGCSVLGSEAERDSGRQAPLKTEGPVLSLQAGGNRLAGLEDRLLSGVYQDGMTVRELLSASGSLRYADDGTGIAAVSGVTLGRGMAWSVLLNGKELTQDQWSSRVNAGDSITLNAEPAERESGDSAIVYINGGTLQPELMHTYVLPYEKEITVRGLLKASGTVVLGEDNRSIRQAGGYDPKREETWRLKVNGKLLTEDGMDMRLRPLDVVEIQLTAG